MPASLNIDQEQIAAFCRKWQVKEISLFGSALGEDFGPDSDVDLLLNFSPEASWGLFDLARMQHELEVIFGRPVDVISRRGLEQSGNPWRREAILNSARVLHAA